MDKYMKIGEGIDVLPLLLEIQRQPYLWDRNDARLMKEGPHWQSHDIWLRYKDETENKINNDYENFSDQHDSVWYPAFYELPSARRLIFNLMARVEGERLGAVLIYKLQPGKSIAPHVDTGWHVDYYEKFNICLQSNPRARFYYSDQAMVVKMGEAHWFLNNVEHGAINEGDDDHIIMTVCIRTHDFRTRCKGGV